MKTFAGLMCLCILTLCCSNLASAGPRRQAGQQFATLNMPQIYRQLPEVEKVTLYLKSRKEAYQKELDDGTKELYNLMREIKEKKGKVPPADLKAKEASWRRKKFDLDLKFQQLKGKLQKIEKREFEALKARINVAIGQTVRAKKIDLVFEKQWLYFGETIDITNDVLALLLKNTSQPHR